MKEIRLKKVVLNGFRGQNREIEFKPEHTKIAGANGTGKTSVYVAVKWCLTGVDERNRTNYNLFDDKLDFTPENSTPVAVELYVDVADVEYVLKRQAMQKWVRKRGSAEYTKASSDEYKFYVDGLELSATAYKEKVAEIFNMDVEKLKLCMDVLYYQLLDWKELRKHFADIVGVIKDSDMKGDYAEVLPYLEKYNNGEKAKEFIRQQVNPLKQQAKDIDALIKAQETLLPDLSVVDKAEQQIKDKEARIAEINREILGLEDANKPYVAKRQAEVAEINTLTSQYSEAKMAYETKQRSELAMIELEIHTANQHNAEIENAKKRNAHILEQHAEAIRVCKDTIDELVREREMLQSQNEEIKSRVFTGRICPNCGQEYPADKMAELQAKFYADNEAMRAPIVERGKFVRARLDAQKERLLKLEQEDMSFEVGDVTSIDVEEIKQRLERVKMSHTPFEETDGAKFLMATINEKNTALTVVPNVDSAALREESAQLVTEIKELSQITARREVLEAVTKAIDKHKNDKREVGIALAKWEGLLDKLMSREREWADIVRDRANEYLEYSHVEMVDISKSGELVDTCTLSINGVDRGVTNHANKTIIGADISNAICKRYGVSLPLFIDDFEHFTSNLRMAGDRQVVTLSANGDYPELTIL